MSDQIPYQPNNDMSDVRIKPTMFGAMGKAMGNVVYRTGQFIGAVPWETPRRTETGIDVLGNEFKLTETQRAKARLMGEKLYHAFVSGRFSFMANDDGKSEETPEMRREYWKLALTEPALDAALWTKIVAVISNELIIKPASKSGYDRALADWVHDCITRCKGGLRNIGEQILYHGLIYGNVLCEPKLKHEKRDVHKGLFPYGFWTMKDFVAIDPGDYRLEIDGFRNITGVWSSKTAEWFDPSYYVFWAHRPVYGNKGGVSSVRSCRRACILLKMAHNYRGIYLEQFGLPMIKASYPQGNDEAESIARLAIKHARSLGYILTPEGVDVEALQIASRGETEYQDAIDDYRKEIFLAQTGSYLYAMEGSVGHAAGNSETHRSTLDLVVSYLSKIIEEILNDSIIPQLVGLNVYNADPPRAMIGGVNDSDLAASVAIDDKLISWGVELDEDEVRERYHRAAPKTGGRKIGGASRLLLGNDNASSNPFQQNPTQPQAQMPGQAQGQQGGEPATKLPTQLLPKQVGTQPIDPNAQATPAKSTKTPKGDPKESFADDGGDDLSQQTDYTCGTASLRFALDSFSQDVPTESMLAMLLGTTPLKGTSAASIIRVARQSGLEAEGSANMTMAGLNDELQRGAVVMTPIQKYGPTKERQQDQHGHWVVVTRFDQTTGMIEYFDPTLGKDQPCWETIVTFASNWHDRDGDGKMLPRYAITLNKADSKEQFSDDTEQAKPLGYISIPLPELAQYFNKVASLVDPGDLISPEESPHITLLYGCQPESYESAAKLSSEIAPVKITFGGLFSLSPADKDYDVLAFKVYSSGLEKANYAMASGLEVAQTYDQYLPHATVARIKRGSAGRYTTPDFAGFDALIGDTKLVEGAEFCTKGGNAFSLPFAAVSDLPVLKFSDDQPASDEVATPGKDGDKADDLLQQVKVDGTQVLSQICKMAFKRILKSGSVGGTELFDIAERAELAEALLGCVVNADLLGRSSTLLKFMRDSDVSRVDRFTDETSFDSFSSSLDPLAPQAAIDYFKGLFPAMGIDPVTYLPQKRRVAFTLAVATEKTLLDKVQTLLHDALQQGTLDTQYKIDDLLEATGVAPSNPQYGEMVFRTNMMDAYTTGTTDQAKDPVIAEAYPVWRYDGIDDERAGKDHRPKFGKYYPSSASFSDVRGDRPYNCRCSPTMIHKITWMKLQDQGKRVEVSW